MSAWGRGIPDFTFWLSWGFGKLGNSKILSPKGEKFHEKPWWMGTSRSSLQTLHHCGFLVLGNTQKILTEIWHQFWDKNDGENICHRNYFQIPRALSELPANWPGLYFKTEIIWKIKILLWKLFLYIVNYLAMIILRFSFKIENAQQRNNALLFVALHAGNHFLLSFFQLPRYIYK